VENRAATAATSSRYETNTRYRSRSFTDDEPGSIEASMPEDFPLARCYRFDPDQAGEETDEGNPRLLAALGEYPEPVVRGGIQRDHDGQVKEKMRSSREPKVS
jgi:hypothetical protein